MPTDPTGPVEPAVPVPAGHVSLRPAAPGDAPAVAEVYLASRRAAAMPPLVHPDDEVRSWLADRLAHDEVWIAETGGRVVGYNRLTPTWLDDLYVAPPYAGAGVGSALLDLAKARRPEGFCLWVFVENAPARSFYRRHGLVELEHTDGAGNEERAPDIRLAWPGERPRAFLGALLADVDEQVSDLMARRTALLRAVQRCPADP